MRRVGLYGRPKGPEKPEKTSGSRGGGILSARSLLEAALGDGVGVELSTTGRMRAKGPSGCFGQMAPGVKGEARRADVGGAPAGNLVRGLAGSAPRPASAG